VKAPRKESATNAMATWETVVHPSPELMMDINFIYFSGQKKSGAATTDNDAITSRHGSEAKLPAHFGQAITRADSRTGSLLKYIGPKGNNGS
jgi:hypothetical protein